MTRPVIRPEEALQLLAMRKRARAWSGWIARENHAGHLYGIAQLCSDDGVTIPGLTVQMEVKAPITADVCLFLFSLMRLRGRERSPMYQLEVAPKGKRTHNGITTIYGPHEHVGSLEPTPVVDQNVDCAGWSRCLGWFVDRVNVLDFYPTDPFSS